MRNSPLEKMCEVLRAVALSPTPVDLRVGGALDLDVGMTLAQAQLIDGLLDRSQQRTQLFEAQITVAGAEALVRWTELIERETLAGRMTTAGLALLNMVAGAAITLASQWVSTLF